MDNNVNFQLEIIKKWCNNVKSAIQVDLNEWNNLPPQTSHIKNVTRTLKNQYFSSQISILLDVLCAAQCLLHIFWQPLYKVGCKFFQLTFGYMKVFHNSIH